MFQLVQIVQLVVLDSDMKKMKIIYELIHHIGNVILKEGVEIGNNTAIDRGVIGSTVLHKNVKVDNLVHIAHGVVIHENSMIIANTMIAGSAIIEKNTWVAPSASIINNVIVGEESVIGMGAVVIRNIENQSIAVGNPAKRLNSGNERFLGISAWRILAKLNYTLIKVRIAISPACLIKRQKHSQSFQT